MNRSRYSGAYAAIIMFACVVLQIILPGYLPAQPLPQVYYTSMFGYSYSNPHPGSGSSYSCNFYLGHSPDNPLVVNSVRLVSHYNSDGHSTTDTTYYAFDGSFEQHDGYFICRSFGGWDTISPNMVYRTSKISNDGYYWEDDYSLEANNINSIHCVWYDYNDDMKLLKATYKYWDGSWDKLECEVDSVGRRLQDITSHSADSLSWIPYSRCRYVFTGNPSSFAEDFEKYLTYPLAYYINPRSIMPIYINNEWEIESYNNSWINGGEWVDDYISMFNLYETTTGYSMYYYSSFNSWDVNGLLTTLNLPNAYDATGYRMGYSHTSQLDVDDELVTSVPKLSIWPNPSRGQSRLKLDIANQTDVSLKTYNLRGQLIKRESYHPSPNIENDYCWNACDAKGNALTNGVYLIKIDWKGGSRISRIVVLK